MWSLESEESSYSPMSQGIDIKDSKDQMLQ